MRVPGYLDRYPAKMVGHLAESLIDKFAKGCECILDPFCGSGSVLRAASDRGIAALGSDINPYAVLLTRVKLHGFDIEVATKVFEDLAVAVDSARDGIPHEESLRYWFHPATLEELSALFFGARQLNLLDSPEGQAIVLALLLSVRLCCRADTRSPKPFISKIARETRLQIRYQPVQVAREVLHRLGAAYGGYTGRVHEVALGDARSKSFAMRVHGRFDCVVTSPPYINAQDYFRNFKLELYLSRPLFGDAVDIQHSIVGRDRGSFHRDDTWDLLSKRSLQFGSLEDCLQATSPRSWQVVAQYFVDLTAVLDNLKGTIRPDGRLILVCGDNLVAGIPIRTYGIVDELCASIGFVKIDEVESTIQARMVPPQRCGHKGLIKSEIAMVYMSGSS